MKVLVTGGAGFIGRWLVKKLLAKQYHVYVIDDLSNGRMENLEEFSNNLYLKSFITASILNDEILDEIFKTKFDIVFHLAASINVQDSIDNPWKTFENDTIGTLKILERCKANNTRFVLMSTCMVYDRATNEEGINENHPTIAASPYAGSKLAAENMAISYYHAYGLPVTIVRPFNTYGPYQKSSGEGGVIAIFIKKSLKGEILNIYGDGTQTRDFLYVEDCADFLIKAGESEKSIGKIINAGTGKDITINELALKIAKNENKIKHVEHIHPQSEIQKLLCDYSLAKDLLNWEPKYSLDEGIELTKNWIAANIEEI